MRELLLKFFMAPFALVYGLVISTRNRIYAWGLLKSAKYNLPVIGVGNLTMGGAGKTPHVEYLIRLVSPYLVTGILSRGYRRKTKGFRVVERTDTSLTAGDEPLQYRLKYPEVVVAVSESRSIGIPQMLQYRPDIRVVLLDDSYQHLSVTPGLNILLTEYYRPYSIDHLLPVGRLREWKSGANRSDIIIVTKCPDEMDPQETEALKASLNVLPRQKIFFSRYVYGLPYHIIRGSRHELADYDELILLSAIADESYLLDYLDQKADRVHTMIYEDHHYFSPHEISLLKQKYENLKYKNAAIVTTEKDATRLILHHGFIREHNLPILVLPLKVSFVDNDGDAFDLAIQNFLLSFKA